MRLIVELPIQKMLLFPGLCCRWEWKNSNFGLCVILGVNCAKAVAKCILCISMELLDLLWSAAIGVWCIRGQAGSAMLISIDIFMVIRTFEMKLTTGFFA